MQGRKEEDKLWRSKCGLGVPISVVHDTLAWPAVACQLFSAIRRFRNAIFGDNTVEECVERVRSEESAGWIQL